MPSGAGFVEPNAENFIRSFSMSILIDFGAIRFWNLSRSPKSLNKSIKNPLFWRSMSSKVIEFGANREPVYDFLLVINSNLGFILHCYWDTATSWPKIANFPPPFSALIRDDPLPIYRKALRFLKPRVFQAADGEDLIILACTIFDWFTRVTDGRSDGQTDRRTERQTKLRWLRRAKTVGL